MTPDPGWTPPADPADLVIIYFWPALLVVMTIASASWAAWRRCRGEGRV